MKVGILKEIKSRENRVAMTPGGVEQMAARGHSVQIEKAAGRGSGYPGLVDPGVSGVAEKGPYAGTRVYPASYGGIHERERPYQELP